ncbi:hypothetical protein OH738_20690 [Streptomyces hirsutus]|uniref:hypothetical protein n=1 Tax=Streptomyces hirsutus TaxID=35620 RepID=UPI00386C1CA6|nr:hypothetical protein OH738_20690 [Streptomyces hirsutus]
MTGDSRRERRRALLRDDPGEAERAARLLDRLGTENRDDEEIEAEHRASRLAAAQEYAPRARLDEELQLRETKDRDQEIIISGRITELRESGLVKVKTGTAKNAPAYDVRFEEPEALLRMRPGLGDNVHFRVRFRQQLDSMGTARSTEYTYLGPAAEQTSLPLEP